MKPLLLPLVLLLAAAVLLPACKDLGTAPVTVSAVSPPPPPAGSTVSYKNDLLPILESAGCIGCHGGTSGLTVGSVAGLLRGGLHGPAIVPGKADSSNIALKISPTPPFGARMPQGGPYLSSTAIQLIRDWINQGAKDN